MKTAAMARRAALRAAHRVASERPLIAAKSALPQVPPGYQARPRLEEMLGEAAAHKLTLVTGPAGSGKTALLAAWARGNTGVAWLTLDEFDNDPAGLWTYLINVLGGTAVSGVPRSQPTLVAALTGWVGRLRKPVVLVLDNVESLTERPAQAMIAALLRPGLPGLRLVLASRTPLPLPVGRLRLAGEVAEIGPDDLAFTAEEAPADLVHRTDGLAAAICLAAQQGDDSLDAYVRSEIFLPLPERDRDFLLQTSVVGSMSPELAACLTERRDAGSVLERLRAAGLVRWTDGSREELRIRRPLLDFVRREAKVMMGEELTKRHLRAAQWFADHGRPLDAARHAALGEDWQLAAEIVVRQAAPDLFGARAFELRKVLAGLPAAEAGHHPEVTAGIALLSADRGDLDAAEAYAGLARKHLAGLPEERAMPLRAVLDLVTLMADQKREDFKAVEAGACGLVARLKGPEGCLVPAATGLRAVALAAQGTARLWAGRVDEARTLLSHAADSDLSLVAADARSKLAVLQAIRGEIGDALSLLGKDRPEAVPGRVALAVVHWLRGDNAAALAALPDDPVTAGGKLMAASVRARVLISQRNMPAARAALAGAEEWVSGDRTTALLDDWLATTRAALHLDEGRPINALTALNGALTEHDSPFHQQAQILAARAYLASSAPARAVNLIDAARRRGLAPWPEVEAWLVSAVAAEQLGREGTARIALAEAVAAAEAAGLTQPLQDAGPSLRALLDANRDLLDSLEVAADEPEPAFRLIEPITEREGDVLRYLPTLLRRNDIARELSVSSNTVKAHVRSLYHKLGVGSRRDAVDRARALGLLR